MIVDCMTDNRNRTASEVRHAFTKHGGNLGTDGSVSYMFSKQGVISFAPGIDEDTVMEAALDSGAEDVVVNDDGSIDVLTAPDALTAVQEAMAAGGLKPDNAEEIYSAATTAQLDRETAEKLLRMVETLEDLDDVQEVYSNADIPEELLESLD